MIPTIMALRLNFVTSSQFILDENQKFWLNTRGTDHVFTIWSLDLEVDIRVLPPRSNDQIVSKIVLARYLKNEQDRGLARLSKIKQNKARFLGKIKQD